MTTLTPTVTQLRVLEAYARLGSQKAVAHELGVSVQTIKNHMNALYVRLGVGGAMEALHALGWVTAPNLSGVPACGWLAFCGKPDGHHGQHGGFRPLLRTAA
jgi:DNA-binding CsgD family transcriptional regulator